MMDLKKIMRSRYKVLLSVEFAPEGFADEEFAAIYSPYINARTDYSATRVLKYY